MELDLPLDRTAAAPLTDQIYSGIRTAILDGRVSPGARLPSTRELARLLGVARFTIDDAYGRLAAEGYIAGRQGSGTYVEEVALLAGAPTSNAPTSGHAPAGPALSAWAARQATLPRRPPLLTTPAFDFTTGTPAIDRFPAATWQRLLAREAREHATERFAYGAEAGWPALRTAVAAYLARSRGVRCEPSQVVITSGAQQTLDLLIRLFVDPGDTVLIEDPGYFAARALFALASADVRPVAVDHDGLRTDDLPTRGARVKLLYVTPSHQYPTGVVLSLPRRLALLRYAAQTGVLVIEDDYDGELRYGARPVPALMALAAQDASSRVAYVGTFSKVFFPSLRLGYVVLPRPLAASFLGVLGVVDRPPPTLLQAAAAAFIEAGHFERHLARMRRVYAARQRALIEALEREFGGKAHRVTSESGAGLHELVRFDLDLSEAEMLHRAAAAGIQLEGAARCYSDPPSAPHILFGYAATPEERIRAGIGRLAKALLAPDRR